MRRGSLIAVLLLVLGGSPAAAARFPRWAADAMEKVSLAGYADADAVVVLEQWQIKLKAGARAGTRRRLVHVLTEDGREHTTLALSSSSLDRYEKIRVWVRRPDGKVRKYFEDDGSLLSLVRRKILDDRTVLVLSPPDVGPGSTVALEAGLFRAADIPQDLFPLQEAIPVAQTHISVDRRGGWDVEGRAFGVGAEATESAAGQPAWVFRDLAAAKARGAPPEAPQPPGAVFALNYVPPGGQAAFRSWNSTARWALEQFGWRPGERSEVPAAPEPETVGLADMVESEGRAARALRYFSIALGTGGFVPRQPGTTLARGFGDCKDKAQVMVAALERRGRPAYPVLIIAPSDGYVPEGLPSPFLFNHAVVAIPWDGGPSGPGITVVSHPTLGPLRIYDATLSAASGMDTGLRLERAPALVLHPSTAGLVYLPETPAESNRLTRRHEWTIAQDGSVRANVEITAEGFERAWFEDEGGNLVSGKDLKSLTRAIVSGVAGEAQGLEVEPLTKREDGVWIYRGEYRLPAFVAEFGSVRAVEIGRFLSVDVVPLPDEAHDSATHVSLPGRWAESFRIHHPGMSHIGNAEDFELSNDVGHARLSWTPEGDVLEVHREIELRAREVPPEKASQLHELRAAVRRLNRLILLFE